MAAEESGGFIDMVSDEEIIAAYSLLAASEGTFGEPASAASVAGLAKDVRLGRLPKGATVVCTITGHGLKDPDTGLRAAAKPASLPAHLEAIEQHLGLWGSSGG